MNSTRLLTLAILSAVALGANAERIPPSFNLDSLSPAAGWQTTKKITVTGEFTDDRGFRKIEYRLRGKSWKEAHFVKEGTVASGTITATFTFNLKLQRKEYSRVEIRAVDVDGVESDYITRRYRWDRYGFVVRDDMPTTNTDNGTGNGDDTGGTGGGTGNGNGTINIGGDNSGNRNTGGDTNTDGGTDVTASPGEFTATPNQVAVLELFNITTPPAIELSWNFPGATSVEIDNGVGSVGESGSRSIASPTITTTYTLTALVDGETVVSQAVVFATTS